MKLFNDLHYLPMSGIILPLYHFAPPPCIILPPIISPHPWKSFNDLHYILMSRIILPPWFILPPYYFAPIILPPGNGLMIYTIYPCPISFCPLIIFPLSFCPLDSFCPLEMIYWFTLFTQCPISILRYILMSRIILPPWFLLPPIILPPGIGLMIYTFYQCPISFCPLGIVYWFRLFTHVPYHFAPWIHFAPWKWFIDLHYLPMSHIILPPVLDPLVGAVVLFSTPALQCRGAIAIHPASASALGLALVSACKMLGQMLK